MTKSKNLIVRQTIWEEKKRRRAPTVTNVGWQGFCQLAAMLECGSASDLIERMGRCDFSPQAISSIRAALPAIPKGEQNGQT